MRTLFKVVFCLAVGGALSMSAPVALGQTAADSQKPVDLGPPYYDPAVQFWSGQDVVPTFDGWLQNDDGSFTLLFGYMNRNYREELVIPPGPNNHVEPGGIDQGQPTLFAPRRQKWVYRLKVPSDFGTKKVVWTLTSHGRTETATGWLVRDLQVSPRMLMAKGNLSPGLEDPNKPPSISVAPPADASIARPLDLTASVTDDGLPKSAVPAMNMDHSGSTGSAQTNSTRRPIKLTVSWLEYRGPAGVTFDESGPIEVSDRMGGKVTTAAHFSQPGTYILIATADDSDLTTSKTITVEVAK